MTTLTTAVFVLFLAGQPSTAVIETAPDITHAEFREYVLHDPAVKKAVKLARAKCYTVYGWDRCQIAQWKRFE